MRKVLFDPSSRLPDCGSCARWPRPARSRLPPASPRLHAVGGLPAGRVSRSRRRRPRLCDRNRQGVTLMLAGARLLPRAIRILDELDAVRREATGEPIAAGPVRLGSFATAAAGLVPKALASLPPELHGHAARGHHARAHPGPPRGHARPGDPRPHASLPPPGRRDPRAPPHHAVRARTGHRRLRRPPVRRYASGGGRAARAAGLGRLAGPTHPSRCSACGRA